MATNNTNTAAINDTLDTVKKLKDNAVEIGTAAAIRIKYETIAAARDAVDTVSTVEGDNNGTDKRKVWKAILATAATAHRSAVSDATMKAAGIVEEVRTEYLFRVATVYRAAVNYADKYNGGSDTAKKNTRNALFTEYKALLSFLSGKPVKEVKASADDAVSIMHAATRTIKGGVEYAAYQKQDGTTGARMVKGAAATATVSPVSFQKELERFMVDRLLGFDGVMSYNAAKDTTANNTALREKAVAPVVLEPATAQTEQGTAENTAA